jgi:UDP:flavonoid glycosyltransferase YjiC (YdhE family)
VNELVQRGEEVFYFSIGDFKNKIEEVGANYLDLNYEMKNPFLNGNPFDQLQEDMISNVLSQIKERTLEKVPELYDKIKNLSIDCVIYHPASLWGRELAKKLNVPAATFHSTFLLNDEVTSFLAKDNKAMATIMSNIMSAAEDLNLIPFPKAYQLNNKIYDERYVFFGPSISSNDQSLPFDLDEHKPILYISLGTLNNNKPEFFNLCIEAFRDTPYQVILSIGKFIDKEVLSERPANFIIESSVPQLEVLKRTDVMISHGGMNSTMEALWNGVPLVEIPFTPEQHLNAHQVEKLGLGILLNPEHLNKNILREAVERLFHSNYKDKAKEMQKVMHEAGGYAYAADCLQKYTRTKMSKSQELVARGIEG